MNPATFRAHLADPNLPAYCRELDVDCPLDRWISYAVKVLREGGVETFESCHAGPGHSFPEPTIRFHGTDAAGFAALAVAMNYGLPVRDLRLYWTMTYGHPTGPSWEMTFDRRALIRRQLAAERGGAIS